ncbi:autophagy-related protein 16 [Phaeosphaeriaceae sp. PMI808]|nr:autophagy-related protein 16 [Phaeosphaeriaceae sp. PMI808]
MSNALGDYLSAIEVRDLREKRHSEYIQAYTRLADRTAGTVGSKAQDEPGDASTPDSLAQMRTELAMTQKTRSELETKLSTVNTELSALKIVDSQHRQRIEQLEKAKASLERRGKDRVDELRGKGKFVEDIQDEMVALTLQLNMAEQDKAKLKRENDELTKRWVQKMEEEAKKMNDRMGWEDQ